MFEKQTLYCNTLVFISQYKNGCFYIEGYHFLIFSSGVKRFDKRYMDNNIYVRAIYSRRIERVCAKLLVEICVFIS